MKKLSDININFISLVKNPANKKELIFKSGEVQPNFQKEIILKSLSKDGVAYGIVYSPYEVDTQGDWTTPEEIKKAAWRFMQNKHTANIDKEHSFMTEKAFVCESWIVKSNDDIFPNQMGAWAVGIKIDDESLKELIEKGEITGLSMAGVAVKEEHELVKDETNLSKGAQMPQVDELIAKNAELEAIIKSKGDEAAAIIKSKDDEISELKNELEAKNSEISELKKSHKADIVERLVKSGEMLPSRKETALELDGKAFDEYCEVCKSEAVAVLKKSEFDGDKPKNELNADLAKQMDLKI